MTLLQDISQKGKTCIPYKVIRYKVPNFNSRDNPINFQGTSFQTMDNITGTDETTKQEIADKIFISLSDVYPEPNVITVDRFINYWIEEYPNTFFSPYHKRGSTHVLNGFVFAIWGLYDYYWLELLCLPF